MKDLPTVPEEYVENRTTNAFGKMVASYRAAKLSALSDAKRAMFNRHKVTRVNEKRYKLVEDRVVTPSGKEIIELRLYHLVDGCAVTIKANTEHSIEGGINQLKEFQS